MGGQIFLGVLGGSAGILVSAGVFTVLLSVGLVPRFAGKTHTARHIFLYEEMIVLGTLSGDGLSILGTKAQLGDWICGQLLFGPDTVQLWRAVSSVLLGLFGVFAGVFVGCLALAIAEMLDSIPILTRRIGFRHGLGVMVLSVALGKLAGSLIYFGLRFYETGI